jgi:hypothetical protein
MDCSSPAGLLAMTLLDRRKTVMLYAAAPAKSGTASRNTR